MAQTDAWAGNLSGLGAERQPSACSRGARQYDESMLDEERLQRYRAMTCEERWREVEELMTLAWRSLLELSEEERRRRLDLVREEHELSDAIILEHLRRLS